MTIVDVRIYFMMLEGEANYLATDLNAVAAKKQTCSSPALTSGTQPRTRA